MITWDEKKRNRVIKDHGVDFALIEDIFGDPNGLFIEDFNHSTEVEERTDVIGMTARYGMVFAAFVYDGEDDIRLVTARRAERWMVKAYEKRKKGL